MQLYIFVSILNWQRKTVQTNGTNIFMDEKKSSVELKSENKNYFYKVGREYWKKKKLSTDTTDTNRKSKSAIERWPLCWIIKQIRKLTHLLCTNKCATIWKIEHWQIAILNEPPANMAFDAIWNVFILCGIQNQVRFNLHRKHVQRKYWIHWTFDEAVIKFSVLTNILFKII